MAAARLIVYDDLTCWVLSYVEEHPGIWTANLCRLLNGIPDTRQGVIYCGLCSQYANQRKRRRAAMYAAQPTLPGLPPPYQLHAPCPRMQLRRLQDILRKLENVCLMVYGIPMSAIPDPRNRRGWDFATRWYPCP